MRGIKSVENGMKKGQCRDCFFFFFQAEDGIRDTSVTGVQTCALPILAPYCTAILVPAGKLDPGVIIISVGFNLILPPLEIGRASCRERV